MRKLAIAIIAVALSAEEKKQPLAIAEGDKQIIRLAQLEAENISLRMTLLQQQYTDLVKQQQAAQTKLTSAIDRVREISGAKEYDLNIQAWAWVKKAEK